MTEVKFLHHVLVISVLIVAACGQHPSDRWTTESETANERSSASTSALYVPPGYTSVWDDQFNAPTIDENNWIAGTLRSANGDLVPGAVGEHLLNAGYAGYVVVEDSYIDNGALVLRNQKRPYTGTSPAGNYAYTSGWVMSMHKVSFNRGYLEIRAKFPSGDKVWPAIWLIAEDLVWGPEWDVFEYFGYRKDLASVGSGSESYDKMGTHLATGEWPSVNWRSHWIARYDAVYDCEAWHAYGFEWTTTEAIWYIDGKEVHRLNASDVAKGQWPDEEMYIVLNNGVRTESPDSTTTWPNYLVIDYIELCQEQ